MPRIILMILWVLAAIVVPSAVSAEDPHEDGFLPFTGPQEPWPISATPFRPERRHVVPVFEQYPPWPYAVLGFVKAAGNRKDRVLGELARSAREAGGDGVILAGRQTRELEGLSIEHDWDPFSASTQISLGLFDHELTGVVIRQFPTDFVVGEERQEVFTGPGLDYRQTNTLAVGERIKVLAREGDWYQCFSPRIQVGWVRMSGCHLPPP